MKQFRTDIIIFIGILILSSVVLLLTVDESVIDIQLHDTYFVLDKITAIVLITEPLMFLVFFIRAFTQKFTAIGSNIGLIVALLFFALITYQIVRFQQNDLRDVTFGSADNEQLIADRRNFIIIAWVLFGLWISAVLLLTYRTLKITKR
jgi:hypothetical protein